VNASLVKDTNMKMIVNPRGSCRRCNFGLEIEEGKTSKEAALITGINVRTAQHYVKKYNADEERRLPCRHRKTNVGNDDKPTAALSPFLIDYIDKYPTSVLADNR
jgi:hypothetical protein